MDPRPDLTIAAIVTPKDADPTTRSATVRCDQAIFTSVHSAVSNGYHLIATSGGVTADEKQQIVKQSPSHGGLCDPSPNATALASYPLSSGRLAVAYTCCAGFEQTARGGQRIYTRVQLIEPADFKRFGYNPFSVVRALISGGQAEPDLAPPPELPVLELGADLAQRFDGLSACVDAVGTDWLRGVLDGLLDGRPIVVVGCFDTWTMVEAVLLGLPGPVRAELSFAAGLRHSLGRGFDLSAVNGEATRLGQTLRGHGIELLEPSSQRTAPVPANTAWGEAVQHRWERSRWTDLANLTSRCYADLSGPALESYGRLCCQRDRLDSADCDGLIAVLVEYAGAMPSDELATELTAALVTDALRRLCDLLSTADLDHLTRCWVDVVELWHRSGATAAWLAPLVGSMLKRMARLSVTDAAQAGSRIVSSVSTRAEDLPVRQALDDLFDHLGEWLHDRPSDEFDQMEPPWRQMSPGGILSDRICELESQFADRLTEQTAAQAETSR